MTESSRKGPCIVITYPFPLGQAAGGARMTREIARHLSKLGANVVILPVSTNALKRRYPRTQIEDKFLGFEFDRDLSRCAVEVVRVPQHPLHYQFDGLCVKKALKDLMRRRRVDVVLSYYHDAAFLPSFLRSRNVKFGYIATWQTYAGLMRRHKRRAREFLGQWVDHQFIIKPYRQADILFATSHHTRRELIDIVGVDGNRIVVCYLGVDPRFIEIPRPAPGEITRFIFFGRIVPSKGFLDALEALGQLSAKGFRNWTYRIVGQGRLEWAKSAAHERGIADKVIVRDAVDDKGLRCELQQAHLAIMPSYAESFGLAFAEAQAAGIPVIAYEAGSVPEIVENGVTGWLAPPRQVDQLARCIEEAVQHPEMTYRAGLAGRERVKQMFTWDKTAATILAGIQTMM